jgi:hypothetical protein
MRETTTSLIVHPKLSQRAPRKAAFGLYEKEISWTRRLCRKHSCSTSEGRAGKHLSYVLDLAQDREWLNKAKDTL